MIIGNSIALYLLLLIPAIIILHIILRRMESRKVSSLLIWERVKKKRKYRLPSILILLLQIFLVTFISLSLAQIKVPFTIPLRRENSVLIIDNSASMNVVEAGKSRLDDAKDKAINVIKGSLGEIMIVTCSNPPEIISSYTGDRDVLIDSVRSIRETEQRNGIEEAMRIASASVTAEGSIIMISDGAFDYVPSETDNFKFIRAGKEHRDNKAISDFHLREKLNSDDYELFLTVSNFSDRRSDYEVTVYREEEPIEVISGTLDAGSSEGRLITLQSDPESEISAVLSGDDLLRSDNRVSAYISSSNRKRVLLVTPGNFFLEKVLEAIPDIQIEKFTGMIETEATIMANMRPMLYSSSGIPVQEIPDNYDVVIYDRIPPLTQDEAGRFIYIDVIPSGLRDSSEKIEPQAVAKTVRHPVTDSVDLSKVSILKARVPLAGPQIKELVSGCNTGLLYSLETRYLKFVYVPFDLTDSDFPLRPSFPVFMNNAINWLTEGYAREEINQSRTGDPLVIGRIEPDFKETEVTLPSGGRRDIEGNLYSDTVKTGMYRLEYANDIQYYSVNLNSRDESNVSSRFPEVTEEDREEKTGEYKFPLITILLIAALIILTAEWIVQEDKW